MNMNVIAKTRELGAVIQQDERYLRFTEARKANEADDALNGTSVVIIIIALVLFFMKGALETSQWNIYLNPYDVPLDKNPEIFLNTVFHNRLNMLIASALFIIFGLNNTRDREKFI